MFPLPEFTTMDDADFVSDTSITEILNMIPNDFNVDEFTNVDGYSGTAEVYLPFNTGELL